MRRFRSALVLALIPSPALACGGFFCNTEAPIDQAGEEIIFGVDTDTGTTTVHVQVTYQGASDDFAWVVPVPSVPELDVSSDSLFTTLAARTRPTHSLLYDYVGDCDWSQFPPSVDEAFESDADGVPETGGNGSDDGVTVIAEQQVGPYDTVTLQATSQEALLTWLNDADYDLPGEMGPVLAPYVASGQYFVALKLSAGNDTGDLRPLAMSYPATSASIPIQLTSVAATPDMRLTVYVLGDARSVPDNYLHVVTNDAAIDWFSGGSNYEDVITLAADEAGGQAFATDFTGPTSQIGNTVWNEAAYSSSRLRGSADPFEWMDHLMSSGLPGNAALLDVLTEVLPLPQTLADQGVTAQNYYNCLSCYAEHVDIEAFDANDATDVLESRLIDGLRSANALLAAHPHLTRMTSSMDAIEMTVDPVFVFNRDLPQSVPNNHVATVTYDCGSGLDPRDAPRTLALPDGRELPVPTEQRLTTDAQTPYEALEPFTSPAAILIEDLSGTGDGEVVFDYRDDAADQAIDAMPARRRGCSSTGTAPTGALALLALLGLGRRRTVKR